MPSYRYQLRINSEEVREIIVGFELIVTKCPRGFFKNVISSLVVHVETGMLYMPCMDTMWSVLLGKRRETNYGLDGRGSIPGRDEIFLFFITGLDWLWGPPSLISNGYRGLFPRGQSGRGVKLTTHLHLVPRSRMVELNLRFPICLYVVVLN
jgi:hypothetical protein